VSLSVSPDTHRAEIARFYSHVVKGPSTADCWLWVGAIADDGYGRFWISRDGHERVVRPHRYALALALHDPLADDVVAEHAVCDNPICVRVDGTRHDHVRASTQLDNLRRMGARGRGGGSWWRWRWQGTDRASIAARSRALRGAVADGWDADRIRVALEAQRTGQERLW
jgi:hypothetical protein